MSGMHVHNRLSPPAKCDGFMDYAESVDDEQRAAHIDGKIPKHEFAPEELCTCGFYTVRLMPHLGPQDVAAHITASPTSRRVLYTEGARVGQYWIDFIAAPEWPQRKVALPRWALLTDTDLTMWDFRPLGEVLEEIAEELQIPILNPKSYKACIDCIRANEWEVEDLPPPEER